MADLRYQVQVDTRGAAQNLQGLQSRVGGLQNTLGGLRTALGALAFGAVVRGALGFAAAVNDTSTATNVARQSILGLGQALTTNGGQASKATDAVQRLSLTLGQAAQGSKSAQQAFADVGLSLTDLQTLDESEILARTIEGLGQIDDAGRRAAIQAQIFGKTMQGVNAAGLAQDFRRLASEQDRNAEAIRKAGEAQDKLNAAMNRFQLAVIRTIEPMVDAFNRLSDEQIATLIDGIVKLGAAIAALTVSIKVIQGLMLAFGAASTVLATILLTASKGMGVLNTTVAIGGGRWAAYTKQLAAATTASAAFAATKKFVLLALTKTIPYALLGFAKLTPLIALATAAVVALNKAFELITGQSIIGWMGKFGDMWRVNVTNPILESDNALTRYLRRLERTGLVKFNGSAGAPAPGATSTTAGTGQGSAADRANREVINTLLEQENKNIQAATRSYREQLAEFNRKFALQTRLTGMTDEQRLVEETMAEAQQEYLNRIEPLVRRIQEIKESGNAADREAIPLLKQGIADITSEYQAQMPVLQELLNMRLQQMEIQREQIRLEELAQAAADRRIAVEESVNKIILDGQRRIQSAYEELELQGLGGVARELRRIEIEERRVADAARERVAAQFGDNDPAGLARAMQEINDATDQVIRRRQDAARKIYEEQRSFANGWKRAFNEYRDNATNAAATAERLFRSATRGMEDAIVGFAKTGKFQWKDFLAMMLEELLRSQIQVLFAQMMGSMQGSMQGLTQGFAPAGGGSSANLLQQLGGFLGGSTQQAQQVRTPGINPAAEPSVLGSLGTVLGSVGTTISKAVTGVSTAVGSVVKGIGSIFGGFFAKGGTLPAGKFGVVGERGPELITGPAGITPLTGLGGGSTTINYNIQAVDAASFQALVARDPGFIYGVTELGRRQLARG